MKISKKKLLNSTQLSPSHKAYLLKYINRMRNVRIYQMVIILSFLLLWEISTRIGIVDSFIFSSPFRVIRCFIDMASDGSIFYHIGVTLMETFISFALVIIIGIIVAIILWWNDSIAKVLEPYLVVLNSLPKSALAPVFIVWLGNNMKTIIVAAVSVGTVPLVQKFYESIILKRITRPYFFDNNKERISISFSISIQTSSILFLYNISF